MRTHGVHSDNILIQYNGVRTRWNSERVRVAGGSCCGTANEHFKVSFFLENDFAARDELFYSELFVDVRHV